MPGCAECGSAFDKYQPWLLISPMRWLCHRCLSYTH